MSDIVLRINPAITGDELNTLFRAAWDNHADTDFDALLNHALLYVCAYEGDRLAGFVKIIWDGGVHAFLLDTTVHPDFRRRGIGVMLVQASAREVRERGIEWLHVDYEPHLAGFYQQCGFRPTDAGLMKLR